MQMEPALCSGIVLSDMVIREAGSGKLSLIGCFTNWNSAQFPFLVHRFYVTAFITNLRGKFNQLNLTVRVENPKTGHVLTSVSGTMRASQDREIPADEVHEIPFPIESFLIHEAGVYHVVILIDNEIIGKRALTVRSVTSGALPDSDAQ